MPHRSRGKGLDGMRKAQSSNQSIEVSGRDKISEGLEGQEKRF
jgi:hypothetical protein